MKTKEQMSYTELKAMSERANQNLYSFINKDGHSFFRVWAKTEEEARELYRKEDGFYKFFAVDVIG